ncbi:unnamed protein product [Cunninghamella echinulata]
MSIPSFQQLLESSKQLVEPSTSRLNQLPYINRELHQINTESQLLVDKSKVNAKNSNINAHYLLAQGGVNSQAIIDQLKHIDTSNTFEKHESIHDSDIDRYLQKSYEQSLETAFKQEINLVKLVDNIKSKSLESNNLQQILENWDQQIPTFSYGNNDREKDIIIKKIIDYGKVIKRLNDDRLQKKNSKFDFLSGLPSTNKGITSTLNHEPTPPQNDHEESLQLLKFITGKFDRLKDDCVWENKSDALDSNTMKTQRLLINLSKEWLEQQFVLYVDDTLWKHARDTKPGGAPSFDSRLHSFVKFVFKKGDRWTDCRFEVVSGTPIWIYIYLLLRSGHALSAIKFVNENTHLFRSVPTFVKYFKEYMDHPDHELSSTSNKCILEEYEEMIYGNLMADPYKILIYKIIGRCKTEKALPETIRTTEDYLWLQLNMIQLQPADTFYYTEPFNLYDLQQLVTNNGPSRFDPKGVNPWVYFKVLVCTLQFEKAINYLYKNEHTRIISVHYGIALAYFGLLRTPIDPLVSTEELLIEKGHQVSLNFSKMLRQYIKSFFMNQHQKNNIEMEQAAVQYIYLLTLYKNESMTKLSYVFIQDLIQFCNNITHILGSRPSGVGRQTGLIDPYKRLLNIDNEASYINLVLDPIGEKYIQDGKLTQAIQVYELSQNYNKMLNIIVNKLGDILSAEINEINTNKPKDIISRQQHKTLIELAKATLDHCDKYLHFNTVIDTYTKNIIESILISFNGLWAYEQHNHKRAIHMFQLACILPLDPNILPTQIQYTGQQLENMKTEGSKALLKNLDGLLLIVSHALYLEWKKLMDNPKTRYVMDHTIQEIKNQMKNLMLYGNTLSKELSPDTIQKLNKEYSLCI